MVSDLVIWVKIVCRTGMINWNCVLLLDIKKVVLPFNMKKNFYGYVIMQIIQMPLTHGELLVPPLLFVIRWWVSF